METEKEKIENTDKIDDTEKADKLESEAHNDQEKENGDIPENVKIFVEQKMSEIIDKYFQKNDEQDKEVVEQDDEQKDEFYI